MSPGVRDGLAVEAMWVGAETAAGLVA